MLWKRLMETGKYLDDLEWLHFLVLEMQDDGYELPAGDYDMVIRIVEDVREYFLSQWMKENI